MRILKLFVYVVAGALVLSGVLVALALTPAVQTWVVRRALTGRTGAALEIGRVAAGPSSADLKNLRFVRNGLVVSAGDVSARYSIWDYLRRRQIALGQVTVRNLVIDARKMTPAGPVAASSGHGPAAALALVTPLRLPVDLRLGRLSVAGRALAAGGRSVTFSVEGGGIAAGRQGDITWKVDYSDAASSAPLRGIHATGALHLRLTADRRVDRLEIENTAAAEGPHLPADQFRVRLTATQPELSAPESGSLELALVRNGQAEPLLAAQVRYEPAKAALDGTWKLAVHGDEFAALLAALGVPEASLQGSGQFSATMLNASADAKGQLEGTLADLRTLGPRFSAVGPVRLRAAFDAGLSGGVVRVTQLGAEITNAKGGTILRVATAQPVSFEVAARRFLPLHTGTALATVEINGLPLVWAQPVVKPVTIEAGELSGAFSVAAAADGRQAHLRSIRPLTLTGVDLRDSGRELVKGMTLSLDPSVDYSSSGIDTKISDCRLTLAAGDTANARVTARLTHPASGPVVEFSIHTRERLVSVLRRFLKFNPGEVSLESTVEGRWEGRMLHLARLDATVANAKGALVAETASLQPLAVDLEGERLTAADPEKPAVRVRLGEVPLALAQALVPHSILQGGVTGATFEVDLPARGAFALRTTAPLRFRQVSVTLDGRPYVSGLDGTADFTAAEHGRSLTAVLRRVAISQGGTPLLSLSGTGQMTLGSGLALSAKGRMEADLAALARQPGLASYTALSRGQADVHFSVTTGEEIRAQGGMTIRDLAGAGSQAVPATLDLTVDAAVKRDGSEGSVRLPVTLAVDGRRSDLTFDGRFQRRASALSFDGNLTSNLLVADDFRGLAALVAAAPGSGNQPAAAAGRPAPSAPASAASGAAVTKADTAPFWAGLSGRFDASLKEVRLGPAYTIRGLQGAVIVAPDRLALDHLQGRYNDKAFKVAGAVTFDRGNSLPYGLTGLVDVPDFDVGAFLRAADPGEPPMMESTVTAKGNVTGRGATPDDLLQNVRGQFDVTGSKGVLRALGRRGDLAGAASTVLGLLGAIQGSDTTVAVGQLAGMLKEMPFDKFSARVERGADLNLKLDALEFVSPAVHLTGSGSVQYQKGVPVTAQPLRVDLQLAAKQQMAYVLNRLKLLSGKTDPQGYYLMSSPFVVTGTLSKPDPQQLWRIVGEAAAGQAVGHLFR